MNEEYRGVRTPQWMQWLSDAGVSSAGSCVTAGHGFLYKSCGFGSHFSRMVIVRSSRRKGWPLSPKLEHRALFLQTQLLSFFFCFSTYTTPKSCPPPAFTRDRAVVTSQAVLSSTSVTLGRRFAPNWSEGSSWTQTAGEAVVKPWSPAS